MSQNPYETWNTRKSLGVMRDVEPAYSYWLPIGFNQEMTSTDEWIDFEKLPAQQRVLAPFVRPLGNGKPIWQDSSNAFRFKPAYVKVKDVIDPLMPLSKKAGIDRSMLETSSLSPMQRLDLIRAAMSVSHVNAIERRWEWMAARAIIDAKVTIAGEEYPAVEVDFRRDANLTVVKTTNFWGVGGVSIFDDIQTYCDAMFNAPFGAFPTRMTFGQKVWNAIRKDEEMLKHMDTNIRDPRATLERGLIAADKVIKVGELQVGGASGAVIEMFLYRDTYIDYETKAVTPFLEANELVFTSSAEAIGGVRAFGAIIDRYAGYQALPIFPRNWVEQGDPAPEYLLHQSAPLMVPVNSNATMKVTPVQR